MKEFADDNFKFDENEKKLSKQVENTVGKVALGWSLLKAFADNTLNLVEMMMSVCLK